MNSILTYVFPLSRWVRAVCVVRAMASSVDLLDREQTQKQNGMKAKKLYLVETRMHKRSKSKSYHTQKINGG